MDADDEQSRKLLAVDLRLSSVSSILDKGTIPELAKKYFGLLFQRAKGQSIGLRVLRAAGEIAATLRTLGAFSDVRQHKLTEHALAVVMHLEEGPWRISLNRNYEVSVIRVNDEEIGNALIVYLTQEGEEENHYQITLRVKGSFGGNKTGRVLGGLGRPSGSTRTSGAGRKKGITVDVTYFPRNPNQPAGQDGAQDDSKAAEDKRRPQAKFMERFRTNQVEMMRGLKAQIGAVENFAEAQRMWQVYYAFNPVLDGKELPPGTTRQIMRFLVVSAGVPGLWQQLDDLDSRLGDALLGCYGEGLGMTALAERLPGVNNPAMASYLVTRGLKKLYEWLPEKSEDFPLDKSAAFPLDALIATRRARQRAAGEKRAEETGSSEWGRRTVSRRWWPTPDNDPIGS